MRIAFFTIASVSLFAVLFFFLRAREEARHRAELEALKEEIAATAARAQPAPVYQITMPRQVTPAEPVSHADSPNVLANAATPGAPPEVDTSPSVEEMAAEFDSAPRDYSLTRTLGAELSNRAVRALPQGSRVREVDCRGHLCRLETAHADQQALNAFVDALFLHPGPDNPHGSVRFNPLVQAADGKVTSIAFIERGGGQ